jgi:hypothetical protein
MFPLKIHRMHHLFDLARNRLEQLMPRFGENKIFIRSLFLNRGGFVAEAYERGLLDFYAILYGANKAFEGFRMVGDSFYESGFYKQAEEGYAAGEEYLHGIPPPQKRKLDPTWKEVRDHCHRYRRLCETRIAELEQL